MVRFLSARIVTLSYLSLLSFLTSPVAFSRVNFIHTMDNQFYTMYIDEKNVYLQKCESQSTPDFDENCEKKYRAKSLPIKNYFNSIPLNSGSFSKEPSGMVVLEVAIQEAKKLADEGNEKAKETLKILLQYKDNLMLVDEHRKELTNELVDETEVKFEFSNNYKEFLEPFSKLKDEIAYVEVEGIPNLNAEQFIKHFNNASKISFDEIPGRYFIHGKQFKFVKNVPAKNDGEYQASWEPILEILKSSTFFSERSFTNVRYTHSVTDPLRIRELPRHSMNVSITHDASGLSFFHERIQDLGIQDFGCPTKYQVRKIQFAGNPVVYLMIKAEIVRGNLEVQPN